MKKAKWKQIPHYMYAKWVVGGVKYVFTRNTMAYTFSTF